MINDNSRNVRMRRLVPVDTGFALSALVGLGVLLAVFMFIGRDSTTTTATSTSAPTTTGSGSTSPMPR